MLLYARLPKNQCGQDFKRYYCVRCGAFLATSQEAIEQKGAARHSYINPAGIRCDFMTFSRCDNVIADERRYEEHSWFDGYTWRFLLCAHCFSHVGWQYDPLKGARGRVFFALLLNAVSFTSVN